MHSPKFVAEDLHHEHVQGSDDRCARHDILDIMIQHADQEDEHEVFQFLNGHSIQHCLDIGEHHDDIDEILASSGVDGISCASHLFYRLLKDLYRTGIGPKQNIGQCLQMLDDDCLPQHFLSLDLGLHTAETHSQISPCHNPAFFPCIFRYPVTATLLWRGPAFLFRGRQRGTDNI